MMMKERNREATAEGRLAYQPPRALRLGRTNAGEGGFVPVCEEPGSAAEGDCGTGNSPTGWCFGVGNSAELCNNQGSGAATCQNPGSGD